MRVSVSRLIGLGLLAAAAPGLACAAEAADARVLPAFGNTIVSTYPDGRTQEIWLKPDGAWAGLSRSHRELAGVWALKGDQVCLRQKSPPTLPLSYCTSLPPDARVGAAWASKDMAGTPIRLKLVRGVQPQS